MAKFRGSASMTIDYDTTSKDVIDFLMKTPSDARVSVYVNHGDRPWESDSTEIEVNWGDA